MTQTSIHRPPTHVDVGPQLPALRRLAAQFDALNATPCTGDYDRRTREIAAAAVGFVKYLVGAVDAAGGSEHHVTDAEVRAHMAAHVAADRELHAAVEQILAVMRPTWVDTTVAQATAHARLTRAAAAFWPARVPAGG